MLTPGSVVASLDVTYGAQREKTDLEVVLVDPKNGDVLAEIEPILVPSRNVIFLETVVSVR